MELEHNHWRLLRNAWTENYVKILHYVTNYSVHYMQSSSNFIMVYLHEKSKCYFHSNWIEFTLSQRVFEWGGKRPLKSTLKGRSPTHVYSYLSRCKLAQWLLSWSWRAKTLPNCMLVLWNQKALLLQCTLQCWLGRDKTCREIVCKAICSTGRMYIVEFLGPLTWNGHIHEEGMCPKRICQEDMK